MRSYIPRTATLSWSPGNLAQAEPLIATGTVSGALDESFSNDSVLEIWKSHYAKGEIPKPIGTVVTTARFNRLVWGYVCAERPMGVLACGLENGELNLWDAQKVIAGAEDALIMRNNTHSGPIKGLHFNPKQPNLLASGGSNGEVYIWDLTNPTKPYSPGARSSKLDEITSLSWNGEVAHILATSSSSGYTVVWNLKTKAEAAALAYGGGSGTSGAGMANGMGGALAAGGRRGMSAVCWHPEQATRLVTASDDDSSPIIMLWDLRNARAPEKILTGHDKGILSLSWCKQDPDLLLSCGKDNRAICWNPQTSEIVGELPPSQNWSFDVQLSPKNPDMIATASFDGRIGIHSLQSTNADEGIESTSAAAAAADPDDIFNSLPAQADAYNRGISLKQPPKWLRKPISASFGFGGQLVSTCNLPGEKGQTQSSTVHLRNVVSEPVIVSRAKRLQEAMETQSLADFCDERSKDASTRPDDVANWKALQTLFRADSRDELVALLGFSKEDVASKVADAIKAFRKTPAATAPGLSAPPTPAAVEVTQLESQGTEAPSSVVASDVNGTADTSVTTTEGTAVSQEEASKEPGLFDGVEAEGGDADFFSTIGAAKSALPSHLADEAVPPISMAPSAAATIGSVGPGSVTSEGPKANTFRIYPADESDADKLVTRAIVLGDFESAVSLCVSTDRFADAILLAVRGGPELLARTQKAYFERRTTSLPYLRLFQSIVSDDLTDIVQNADLNEWQEVFVVICTFATKNEEFVSLAEQLGQRLEFQYTTGAADKAHTKAHRKNAILCYLAAGKLEKVAGMWIDEMKEEEVAIRGGRRVNGVTSSASGADTSLYSAHAEALQTFMEKITVFQSAVQYVDVDLAQPTQDSEVAAIGARTYKLASLYDRIHEYVDVLADQGLVASALQYVGQTPTDYRANQDEAGELVRQRLIQADQVRVGEKEAAGVGKGYGSTTSASSGMPAPPAATSAYAPSVTQAPQASYDGYGGGATFQPYGTSGYEPYNSGYAPQSIQQQQPSQMVPSVQQPALPVMNSIYAPSQPIVPAPPPPIINHNGPSLGSPQSSAPPPPPPKRDVGGWNDIPQGFNAPKRTASAMSAKSAAPITSPFPMAQGAGAVNPGPPNVYGSANAAGPVPPPPRGATPGARPNLTSPPPPPQTSQYGRAPMQGPPRPPPTGPPRGSTPGGARPGPPPASGPYAPAPGQVPMPPPPAGMQHPPAHQQQHMPPQQFNQPPPNAMQGPGGFNRPPMPPMPLQQQQQQQGPPLRSTTPGLGAGPPPQARSASTKPTTKYPPGDRSHIPDSAKPILATLTRELNRFKSITSPAQKKQAEDADRRINTLFDFINCGTLDAKLIPGLHQICQAIEARNHQAALNIYVQLASASPGGDVSMALAGVKMLIGKMNQ